MFSEPLLAFGIYKQYEYALLLDFWISEVDIPVLGNLADFSSFLRGLYKALDLLLVADYLAQIKLIGNIYPGILLV